MKSQQLRGFVRRENDILSTLIFWNAGFGRTPMIQRTSGNGEARSKAGRDYHTKMAVKHLKLGSYSKFYKVLRILEM
ncbi:DUF1501 domain-containing protein [Akkermansiaceae bacterium]|nr:DUF1501 domain-containing protein [Akkermansiaceae bacterium]